MVEEAGHDRGELAGQEDQVGVGLAVQHPPAGGDVVIFHRGDELVEPVQVALLEVEFHHGLGVHADDGGAVIVDRVQVPCLGRVQHRPDLGEDILHFPACFRHGVLPAVDEAATDAAAAECPAWCQADGGGPAWAWMAVMATVLTMSATVQPRLRSFTGLFNPCITGPMATAPLERCTAL